MAVKGTPKELPWTPEQTAILRELGPTHKGEEIAKLVDRSPSSVRARASYLGIKMRHPEKYYGMTRSPVDQVAKRYATVRDIEWAAGFLEGEGHFRRQSNSSERIQAKQVQREPLERLQAIFGGRVYPTSHKKSRDMGKPWNDIWTWDVCGARARGIMMTIYALMSPKRQRQIVGAFDIDWS